MTHKSPKQFQKDYIPDLGVLRARQLEYETHIASMEQEIEIFRRVVAMAVQRLGGEMSIEDDEMIGFDWHENTLELIHDEENPRALVRSRKLFAEAQEETLPFSVEDLPPLSS